MATALATPEAVARAVLEKAPATPPAPGSAAEAAVKIRGKLAEEGPKSALESMRQRQPIEKRIIDEVVDHNIGIERNPDGSKKRPPGTPEATRLTEATKQTKLVKDFLEKGYAGLDAAQKTDAKKLIEQSVRAWPEADALFVGPPPMPVADKDAIIESLLKNTEVAAKVRSVFEQAIDPAKKLDEARLLSIKKALDQAVKNEAAKTAEITKNTTDLTNTNNALDQFADRTSTGGAKGAKLTEIENIKRKLPTLTTNLATNEEELDDINYEITDLEQKKKVLRGRGADTTATETEIATKRTERRNKEKEILRINDRINRKTVLEQEKTTLEQKKQQLDAEIVRLNGELPDFKKETLMQKANYASEQLNRSSQEDDFVDSLRNVLPEAAMQYLQERVAAAETARNVLIEKEKAETVDPAERAILDRLLTRWDKTKVIGIIGKKTITEFNRNQISTDFSILVGQGPQPLMVNMLIDGGFSPADAAIKANDPAFIQKMQPKVVERLVTRRLQSGRITENDARRIMESDWGKGMIDQAIKNRKDIGEAIEKLKGSGILRGGVAEWYKNKSGGNFWKFLALVLGTAALGAAPLGMAAKSVLSEQ